MSVGQPYETTLASSLTVALSTLISFCGIALICIGIFEISEAHLFFTSVDQMRAINPAFLEGEDLSKIWTNFFVIIAIATFCGLSSLVSGIGMLFRKNWARLLWICTLVLMLAALIYNVCLRTIYGHPNFEYAINTFAIIFLLAILIFFFTRQKTRAIFEVI